MKFIVALSLLLAVASAAPKRLVVPVKDAHVGKSRIISGDPADPGQYPFQVINEFEMFLGTSFCGGALISSHWVLTAAHCASGAYSHTVTLGTISSNGDDPNAVVVHTTSHIVHENYDSLYLWNDIALVDLVSDVQFTDLIQPISLGSRVVEPDAPVWVSGWGKTSDSSNWVSPVLNFINLNTISNEDCADVYGGSIVDSTLCCRGHPEHSTCSGDSGGPLFEYDSDEKRHHIGVVSFVHVAGCASGNPSGYGRTSSHISWIESHTGPL
ncbi:hypothetical protein FQA39_LY02954 [Lamprigera yunnana]|nr:hypothetical protein FQA39_LY02954 [Lamprigera yunnana]